ncbi:flavoprotein [Micromonospora sp. M12]
MLYLVVCAAGPAEHIHELVDLLIADGWRVCMIVSPTAAPWLDRAALEDKTGYLVRVGWRMPGDPEPHPPADVVVAAPVTFNTVTKWALGINDTLALGVLNESLGAGCRSLRFRTPGGAGRAPGVHRSPGGAACCRRGRGGGQGAFFGGRAGALGRRHRSGALGSAVLRAIPVGAVEPPDRCGRLR